MKKNEPNTTIDLDIRKFARHVTTVGPRKAFMEFLYGMFIVADEVMRTGINGKSYPKPTHKGEKP